MSLKLLANAINSLSEQEYSVEVLQSLENYLDMNLPADIIKIIEAKATDVAIYLDGIYMEEMAKCVNESEENEDLYQDIIYCH